jgi:DNA adenine methylase
MHSNPGPITLGKCPWASPILRWAGSKRKLLPALISRAPSKFERYFEPFAGSACLFFALKPRPAILSDINSELMATYEIVRSHPHQLHRLIQSFPATSKHYYFLRDTDSTQMTPLQRAARFVYLNRYCFNGVYRTNRRGIFNVPRGTRTGGIPNRRAFYRASIALRSTKLLNLDFENTLAKVRKGDFVYLDPPYATGEHRDRGEYGCGSFSLADIPRLMATLQRIDSAGASFLLSFADCPAIRAANSSWHLESLSVKRHVAGFSHKRLRVKEILMWNCNRTGRLR